MSIKCPSCGLTNPDSALRCDCSYDFSTGVMTSRPKREGGSQKSLEGCADILAIIFAINLLYLLGVKIAPFAARRPLFVSIVVAIILLACLYFWIINYYDPTKSALKALQALDPSSATEVPVTVPSPEIFLAECADETAKASSYCSRTIIRDLAEAKVKEVESVKMAWRLDFVAPNRFLVSQEMWEPEVGVLYDQWVTIGDENLQNSGLWYKTNGDRNAQTNSTLSVARVIELVKNCKPTAMQQYELQGRHFLLAKYGRPRFVRKDEGLYAMQDAFPDCPSTIEVWIEIESKRIVKGALRLKGPGPDSEFVDIEVQQLFTQYDANIQVRPPRWLNMAEPDAEGESTIINNKVDVLPHHR